MKSWKNSWCLNTHTHTHTNYRIINIAFQQSEVSLKQCRIEFYINILYCTVVCGYRATLLRIGSGKGWDQLVLLKPNAHILKNVPPCELIYIWCCKRFLKQILFRLFGASLFLIAVLWAVLWAVLLAVVLLQLFGAKRSATKSKQDLLLDKTISAWSCDEKNMIYWLNCSCCCFFVGEEIY